MRRTHVAPPLAALNAVREGQALSTTLLPLEEANLRTEPCIERLFAQGQTTNHTPAHGNQIITS